MGQNKEIPKGYKDSPLGIIPEKWEVKRLENVCSFYSGGTPSKDVATYWNGNIPWISAATMHKQNINSSNLFITKEGLLNGSKLANNGDVLLLVRGSMLWNKIPICECFCDVAFNQDVKNIKANESVIPKFLLYWLLSQENYILHQVVGTGIGAGKLETQDLKDMLFVLPPLPEQQRIAEILATWDKAIEKQSALIEKLELRKHGLMQQLLTGKKRLKGFDKEWKNNKLADICKIYKGKALSAQDITKGSYPVIAGGQSSPYNHNEFTDENVITISASGAYAGYVALHKYRIWASDCSVVKEIKSISSIDFLFALLTYRQKFIYSLQCGGAQPHVSPKDIASIEYKLPPFSEQKAIANIFIAASKEINTKNDALKLLKKQKKGLMQKLLIGKIKVNS